VVRLSVNFFASSSGLVDHARRQRFSFDDEPEFDEEIQEQIERRFAKDGDHNIANGLHNYSLHHGILPITADLKVIQRGVEIKSDGFKLSTNELLKWDRWTTKERTILARMGKTIDVGELAIRYFSKVEKFYIWLWGRLFEIHATEIMTTNALRAKAQAMSQQIA
jgi:hypothetical protein